MAHLLKTSVQMCIAAPTNIARPIQDLLLNPQNFAPACNASIAYFNSGLKPAWVTRGPFQAIGWRHCLPGGNNLLRAALFAHNRFGVIAPTYSIWLIMPPAEGRARDTNMRLRTNIEPRQIRRHTMIQPSSWSSPPKTAPLRCDALSDSRCKQST
jgi:hypothetical protein